MANERAAAIKLSLQKIAMSRSMEGVELTANTNGSYTFYTKGVDRLTDVWGTMAQASNGKPFKSSDALWTSFQDKIIAFINIPLNGGTSGAAIKGENKKYS